MANTSLKLAEFFKALLGDRAVQSLKNTTQELVTEVANLEDEHHTMEELYNFRMAMHAHLAIMWHRLGLYPVVKSFRHHDGEPCFGGGWFIVTAQLGSGQISNHYKEEYWSLFDIPSVEFAPEWDGHTSEEVLNRLKSELNMLPIQIMRVGLDDSES